MVDNWLGKSIPLSSEYIFPVFTYVRELVQIALDDNMTLLKGFKAHTKEFAMLFWYEVSLPFE